MKLVKGGALQLCGVPPEGLYAGTKQQLIGGYGRKGK